METFMAERLEASLTVKDLENSLAWFRLTFSSVHAA